MSIFRIDFQTQGATPVDVMCAQARANAHHPKIQLGSRAGRKLAVVGGGPLVARDLDELRTWDGDIWGINHTAAWLRGRAVNAALFTVDGGQFESTVQERILASACHPSVCVGDVQTFDLIETHTDGFIGGTASVTRAPLVAIKMGYSSVHFFGCEGSFVDQDHVDRHEISPHILIIRAGGVDYKTWPQFLVQSLELARLFAEFPSIFVNRSGGLLDAIIQYPDGWSVVAVSAALKAELEKVNGNEGMYEGEYVPADGTQERAA